MTHIDVMTVQDLWKENIDGYFPYLLEIYNPDIKWTDEEKSSYGQEDSYLRVICDENKVIYSGKSYIPASFEFTPPESDGTKIGQASLTISSFDYRIKRMLRSIKLESEVTVMAFFVKVTGYKRNNEITDDVPKSSDKPIYKFKKLDSIKFTMDSATSDKTTAKFNLNYDRSMAQNVPYYIATQDRVPASRGQ